MIDAVADAITRVRDPHAEFEGTLTVGIDVLFAALSNARRRNAIRTLVDEPEGLDRQTLAREVAAAEVDCESVDLTSAEYKRVYTAFLQTHFSTLGDAGLINQIGNEILPGPNLAAAARLLTLAEQMEADR